MADTEVSMDTQNELNDLRMSDGAVPLYEHVKSFIKDVVNPVPRRTPAIWKFWSASARQSRKSAG